MNWLEDLLGSFFAGNLTGGYQNCNKHMSIDDFFEIKTPKIEVNSGSGWDSGDSASFRSGWL